MFTNKPEFRVKEVIKLSKLSSDVLNSLLAESEVYLSKRILTYVLAQQISIQIASDRDLVHLRGYATELEDYTLLQLLNFTDSQGIEVDTFDIKFRIWTVIFNNLRELTIKDTAIQRALTNTDETFEYAKDVFVKLDRFIDEPNDIDGQPFIIAKESLIRFSTREEVESLGLSLEIDIPNQMDRESVVNFILRGLEDSNPALKDELMNMSMEEIEKYARENFVADEIKLSKKEIVNFILDNYSPEEHQILKIEYQKHLEIPSLYNYQTDDDLDEASLKPGKLFDEDLKEMIAAIVRGENHQLIEDISEEKSKEELETIMSKIVKSYQAPQRDEEERLLRKIDELQHKLAEKQSYDPNMISLMNKVSNMESQYMMPQSASNRDDLLMKKIEEIENKISMLARGENPELTEAQLVEKTLLSKIAELEEKLSYQRSNDVFVNTPVVENQHEESDESVEMVENPPFEVESDDDYEYDMDHFVPKTPVIVTEEDNEQVDDNEEVSLPEPPEVEPVGPSATELMLLQKLEEIERKLEEKDSEIAELKQVAAKSNEIVVEEPVFEVVEDNSVEEVVITEESTQEETTEPKQEVVSEPEEEEVLNFLDDDKTEETSEQESTEEEVEETVLEDNDSIVIAETDSDETLEEILADIEELETESTIEDIHTELKTEVVDKEQSDFDKFIEEIHSTSDSDSVKVRRRHTVKFVKVFWRAAAIWVMLVAISAIILMVYNSL